MHRLISTLVAAVALASQAGALGEQTNKHYPTNRPPLRQTKLVALPLGAVKPQGWLKDQLTVQANGLTGHLDEFWPSLVGSAWRGGPGEGWERGPYYLDGLVPLAYVLDDPRLIAKAKPWIEWTLSSGRPDGWFGPEKNKDRWPLAVAMKVLTQYQEATGDPRVVPLLKGYFGYLKNNPPDWPDKDWRGARAVENLLAAYWLYRRTGDPQILEVAESIVKHSRDWQGYFNQFPWTLEALAARKPRYDMSTHVVNVGMALKYPGVWYQQSADERSREAVYRGLASLDEHHGQVAGRFSGDEHLAGKNPTQGTELCAVVESMFSLENLIEILGDPAFGDRLEMLAYNAHPGTCTPDYWAHQYDQQANQVLSSVAKRRWSTNGDASNVYGLEPNFGCCTSNMHQGWPKLASHLWMATHDQGLAAVAYGPSTVKAKVADGTEATIDETTDYPFGETIRFKITAAKPLAFPLHLRIPSWAAGATVAIAGEQASGKPETLEPGQFAVVRRTWQSGDELTLSLPMKLRIETRYRGAIAIYRGPLVYSLKIGERFESIKRHHPTLPVVDWAVHPTTPWNYGLLVDRDHPEKSIRVARRGKPSKQPFAQKDAPVVLQVQGRAIPAWTLVDNSAGPLPTSPVASGEPLVTLELIPYGCTRLRITEFPVLAESQ